MILQIVLYYAAAPLPDGGSEGTRTDVREI